MRRPSRHRVAALLSREAGLSVLESLFGAESEFELVCLFTQRREPSRVDPERRERPEFARYRSWALARNVPFHVVDSYREAKRMQGLSEQQPFDFVFSVSWAFRVPPFALALPAVAAINQHRGKLPDYALAAPVARALRNGDRQIVLTTHRMVEEYDEGEVLLESAVDADYDDSVPLQSNVERIKRALLPVYPAALRDAALRLIGENAR